MTPAEQQKRLKLLERRHELLKAKRAQKKKYTDQVHELLTRESRRPH